MHAPHPAPRRLVLPLYAFAALDELVPLYPLYALLFTDTGLTPGEVSALFVIWSATAIVLEVPSGALADALSRRALLVAGPLLGAAGYGLWVARPSFWAFAAGFVLWGARGALVSGAFEALVYEELDRAGAAGHFARVLGRAQAAGTAGVVLATAVAAPVAAAGGYPLAGALSVAAGVLTAGAALLLPEHRTAPAPLEEAPDGDSDEPGYLATLRAGLGEARRAPAVRQALLLVAGVTAVWGALEEYTSLLVSDTGVATADVPWWELVVWAGVAAGGLLAGRARLLPPSALRAVVAVAGLAMAGGAAAGRTSGIVVVAVAFGALQAVGVVVGAWLQDAVSGPARATVTSVAALAAEVVTVAAFTVYGLVADAAGNAAAFAVLALVYLPMAGLVTRPGRTATGATMGV